jgi:hypothetical protein
MNNENTENKALVQQEFPNIEGDKTLVDRQKNQVMESHDIHSPVKMIRDEENPSTLVG